ncbi:hypothetical protein [Spirosoma endophyticum]|uniref:Uncharacterized protein n=1 Tax=Spirosoma endophyticum TaxID=662367 RepID=A0A1I2BCQ1_9BACT|nr:hypothetical protein [Spirosoma endophyticum]SFE53668.1 hypothetical protein SAMN05216167_11556 [Spirosoma endophyticum]
MKLFTQTRYYQYFSPFICQIIPAHPARDFWTRILLAFLLSRSLESSIDLVEPVLGSPIDNTWQYYTYLGLETLRYGSWFWGIWYGLVQTIDFAFHPHPKSLFSAANSAFVLTWILVMGAIQFVNRTVEATYAEIITVSLLIAFLVSVIIPTCFGPRRSFSQGESVD